MLEIFMTKGAIAAGAVGFISVILTAVNILPNGTSVVTIEDGQLQGRTGYSRDGKQYLEYLAIPYAEPPVGDLRFEPPVRIKQPWKGVKQATRYPVHCLQFDTLMSGRVLGYEDCLYLNVFTHDIAPSKKKPVLVFIHGGGFVSGASSIYVPSFLMDHDIVLVTFNYRLGPLGFLNLENDLIRGNMGLKDQNLVLRWIKRNVDKFGGDKNLVTLWGESAGAGSTHYHVLSPASKDLFQKAIIQSGSAIAPWAIERSPRKTAVAYGKEVNCPTENMKDMVECLKTLDGAKLVEAQISGMYPTNDSLIFVPSVETVVREDTFISMNPFEMLKSGNFSKIPVMFGVTSGEGNLRTARVDAMPEYIETIDKNWEECGPNLIVNDHVKGHTEIIQDIRDLYFGNASFTEDNHEFRKRFTVACSDGMFYEPVHTAAGLHAKAGSPTHLYYYDYDSYVMPTVYSVSRAVRPDDWLFADIKVYWAILVDLLIKNFVGGEGNPEFGVTHANDLFQIWNTDGITAHFMNDDDTKFSKKFVQVIVDYATNKEQLKFDGVDWPAITLRREEHSDRENSVFQYMRLGKDAEVIDEPFARRMPFWQSVRGKIQGGSE